MLPCRKEIEREGKNTANPFVCYTWALKMAFFLGNSKNIPLPLPQNANFIREAGFAQVAGPAQG